MISLDITRNEIQSGTMAPEHLEAAVSALRDDGIVVLNDVIDRSHLEALNERMQEDLATILAREDAPYNWHTGNVQQDPPPFPPYLFRDLLVNDMVIAVSRAVLGRGIWNGFYSGNTALPGGKEQPWHVDAGQLWPNLEVSPPPYSLVVNVPVVDMEPTNGSTDFWPGTHRDTTVHLQRGDIKIPAEVQAKWRASRQPIQPAVRAGSVILRDVRLWHRGMPNHTDRPRPMLAMIHYIHWWKHREPLPFLPGSEPFLEHPELKTHACFVERAAKYLYHSDAYEYER